MQHSSLAVADYILRQSDENGNTLTPMQLVKLVYLCHGWMLGLHGRPLLDNQVEAWRYGPVSRDLYQAIKAFRSNPVPPSFLCKEKAKFDEFASNVMNQVVEIYGRYSGLELSRLTHASGTPWHKTWILGRSTISNDLIEDHYKEIRLKNTAKPS